MVIGLDEVGRGCWAGPLLAAAVVLDCTIPGLNDSKKLTAKRRVALDASIRQKALAYGIGWVWPDEIDANGLTWAVTRAMSLALDQLAVAYHGPADIIIDGNHDYLQTSQLPAQRGWPVTTEVKADGSVPAVSAASIIAKVARDEYMRQMSFVFPDYGFAGHVGYGTAEHIRALATHGVTPIHRKSYKPVQKLLLQSGS